MGKRLIKGDLCLIPYMDEHEVWEVIDSHVEYGQTVYTVYNSTLDLEFVETADELLLVATKAFAPMYLDHFYGNVRKRPDEGSEHIISFKDIDWTSLTNSASQAQYTANKPEMESSKTIEELRSEKEVKKSYKYPNTVDGQLDHLNDLQFKQSTHSEDSPEHQAYNELIEVTMMRLEKLRKLM